MKFIDLLNLNKEKMLPDAERVYRRSVKRSARKMKMILGLSAAAAAVVCVAIVFSLSFFKNGAEKIPEVVNGTVNLIDTVVANSESGLGMKTNSTIKITTTEDVSVDEMRARVRLEPNGNYTVHKTGVCKYELRFREPLEKNALYNLQAIYNGKVVYRWAFQTESAFAVTGAYPANEQYVSSESAVEVTFSHAEVTGFEAAFQIEPKVEGTFQHYGRTWAFVPSAPLDSATLYTVTVNQSVGGPDGAALAEDYTFSFTTAPYDSYAYLIYQQNEAADTFLDNETPVAAIAYENADMSSANVKVYRFKDSDSYIDAYLKYVRNGSVSGQIVQAAGELYSEFEVTPALSADYHSSYAKAAFVHYPEPLPLGYYFAEIELGGRKLYQLLESTTLSVYTVATNGDYVVWVNDTKSGNPISGMTVSLEGFEEKKTSSKGMVTFSGGEKASEQRVLKVHNGDYPYVAVLNGDAEDPQVKANNEYYSFVSTNSRLYKPYDTVKIFGVILPRKSRAKVPSEVVLKSYPSNREITVSVAKNGLFTAELPLNNTASSYGNVELYVKENYLTSTHFDIAEYELPVYNLSVSTDRLVYRAGEEIIVTGQVTYMDGTPAPNVRVESYNDTFSGVTDQNGCVTARYTAEANNYTYYSNKNYPTVSSVAWHIADGTDNTYYDGADYIVFNDRNLLESSYQEGVLKVRANNIDLSREKEIDPDNVYLYSYDTELFAGSLASMTLTAELHQITYEKKPDGTTYDPINKKVVYSWRFEENDQLVRTFELPIVGGEGSVSLEEKPDENRNYYVILRAPSGETVKQYLTENHYVGNDQGTFNMVADRISVDVNDTVNLVVRDGRNNEAINSGSVLYTVISGEIIETYHCDTARYSLTFNQNYAPDVLVYGAYFDGKHIYSLGYERIEFDIQNAKLSIGMEKGQEIYRPGDTVELVLTVKDQEGNPVSALVNVSVLDRALTLLGGELDDPLYSLYRSRCYATPVYVTCSHRDFSRGELLGGEGGGGDGEMRDDFEDTPFFDTVQTDSSGRATVTFTLPDSITEWKVVARAISKDIEAGMETFSLRSTQEFFVHTAMGDSLKETDDFTVALKGDGTGTAEDVSCTFNVWITDAEGNELANKTSTTPISRYTYLNFGRLKAGAYTVYIQGEWNGHKDSVIRTFTVTDTQASVWLHNQESVEGSLLLNITPRRGNVTMTVVDKEQAFWQEAMARLKNTPGNRADQVLGAYLADQFYACGKWMDSEEMDYSILSEYIGYDGFRLFKDREATDLRVAAKLAAVAPNFCDREALQMIFEQCLNNRYAARADVLISYFGLSSLGEPVLSDLQMLNAAYTDFSPEEAGYLALAFAYAGDQKAAEYVFTTYLEQYLITDHTKTFAMTNGVVDEDLTGCCALLSNRLSLKYSQGLLQYIIETDTENTLLNLELISYLSDFVPDLSGTNTVTVTTGDGRNESYTYPRMGCLVLNLSPQQASEVRIVDVEGASSVSYSYYGDVKDLESFGKKQSMGVSLPSALAVGEVSSIVLYVNVPDDFELANLEITLPVGLRFESGTVRGSTSFYQFGNVYNADVVHTTLFHGSNEITVLVRGALPGNYELEPITVLNSADERYMATEAVQLHVEDKSAS